jgi:hypothetical protein
MHVCVLGIICSNVRIDSGCIGFDFDQIGSLVTLWDF